MEVPVRVLIVEDSEDDTLFLLRELRRSGYEPVYERVYTAAGMEAALGEKEWDLVICDHSMPAFNSSAALEILRRSKGLDIPFILVSGRIGEEAAVAAMKSGANDYVMKENLARLGPAIERELREAGGRRERRRAQGALEMSEARFRQMFEQSPLGIQIFSPDGQTLRVNQAWERLWGVTLDQIPGYNVLEDPQLVEKGIMPYVERAFAGEPIVIPPHKYEPDETIPDVSDVPHRWVQSFIYPVKDANGTVREVVLAHQDITERREAEEALHRAEKKYRSIFENAVEGIFQTTVDGRVVTVNPAMAHILGYDSPQDLPSNAPDVRELYVEPERREELGRVIRQNGAVSGFENKLFRKDGSVVWVSVAVRAVRDESGELVGYEGTVEDITERKRAEEALRRSEELYRAVVEQAAENIFVADVETGRILESNAAFSRSLDYTPQELRKLTLYDVIDHDRASIEHNIQRIVREGRIYIGERRYLRKDGSPVNVEVGASLISYGERKALCVVAHDITERKKAEAALRKIRASERHRIARDMHDVVLQDLIYALQSARLSMAASNVEEREDWQRRVVEALQRAVGDLREAVYNLRLGEAQGQSLARSLESLVELNRQMVQEREIELLIEEDFPETLSGKIGIEVLRIVQEALANVRRHSGARRVEIRVGTEGDRLRVEIEDDGRGLEEGAVPGMGLTGMRERARVIGGELEVEGREDSGTRVLLRAPLDGLLEDAAESRII